MTLLHFLGMFACKSWEHYRLLQVAMEHSVVKVPGNIAPIATCSA